METIVIELLAPADVQNVARLVKSCGLGAWSETDFQNELLNEQAVLLSAQTEKQFCGFVSARLITPEAEILNICVSQSARRQNVASQLLAKLFEIFKTQNVKRVLLEVRETNVVAQNFYRAHQFEVVGRRKRYYADPVEDAVLMALEIGES